MISGTNKPIGAINKSLGQTSISYLGTEWDDSMVNFPGFTFFHGTGWGRTLVAAYDFTPKCLVRYAPHTLPAFLPIMEVSSWLTGRRGISLPFTDACDALCDDHNAIRDLWADLHAHAQSRKWKSWELRGNRARHSDAPVAASFWGHRLDLSSNPDEVFTRLQGAARTSVRKALNQNLTITFATDMTAVRIFHALLCKTRQRHGLPPQPLHFFESLQRNLLATGQGWVVLAKQGDVAVAGAVFLHLGKSAIYKFAASDSAFRDTQANNLVLWRAIEWYSKNGFSSVDFGRTSIANEGLRRFKRSWGAIESSIDYIKFDRNADRFVTMKDQTIGWHTRFFRILPSSLSNLIGAVAYRHLA